MRFIIVVLLVLGTALAAPGDELFLKNKADLEKCMKEVGISLDDIEAAMKTGFSDIDEKLKCTAACILKTKGLLKDDGTFDIEKAIQSVPEDTGLPRDLLVKATEKCGTIKADNDCATAHEILMCTMEEIKAAN